MSPRNKRKSCFSKRTGADVTKRRNTSLHNTDIAAFIRENTIKDTLLLKNPVVILQRLPNILPSGSQKVSNTIDNKSWKTLASSHIRISLNNKKNDKRNSIRLSPNQFLKTSTPKIRQQRREGNSTSNRNSVYGPSEKSFVQEQTALAINSEEKKKNKTYELNEPETPILQRELRQRQKAKEKVKTTLNVHFKRLPLQTKRTRIPVLQTLQQKKKLAEESKNGIVAIIENKSIKGSLFSASRRKSTGKDFMNINSFTGLRGKPKINTRSSPTIKKLDLKNVTPRKVPNFAEIHEKLFAKSESVIDARNRLRERHAALRTLKINNLPMPNLTPKNKSLPHNSNENQFRFKMRIKDATNCILKKQPSVNQLRNKDQQKTREFLKGVRTNRRFELQMKTRNMNR